MSDHDKMMAFGTWLIQRGQALQADLHSLCINVNAPVDAIRVKAGHIEATGFVLQAFRELYHGDLNKFMEERLNQKPEEEDKESQDVPQPG